MDASIEVAGGLGGYDGSHSAGGIPACKEDEYERAGGEDENKEI